jgi:tRNA(fMet)-specific endonuclease VapC
MEKHKVMLDTSAYSAFLRGNDEVKRALQEADAIYLNAIVLGELYSGFAQGSREKKNRDILRDFLSSSRIQIAALDEETAERYAAIITYLRSNGTPIPTNDLWIAATTMQYGLKLLTTDGHYRSVPQIIVECFNV